jgi:hypothetical protein
MEVVAAVIEKYGISAAVIVFLGEKIFTWATGSYWKWKKALEANTAAIDGLRSEMEGFRKNVNKIPKVNDDLRVAFHNLKEIRGKLKMGDLTIPNRPGSLDQ